MRISSLIRGIENLAIGVGGQLAAAGKEFLSDVEKEREVRQRYKAETAKERNARLVELRSLVEAEEMMAGVRARAAIKAKSRRPAAKAKPAKRKAR